MTSFPRDSEAVGFDMVGSIETPQQLEREDAIIASYRLSMKKRKKKKKKSKKPSVASNTSLECTGDYYFSSHDSREYPYTVLLDRIFSELRSKNPNSGIKQNHRLPPPQTKFHGSKKTAWINFTIITQLLNRKPDHVKQFFLAEMNTSGNLDGNKQLLLRGRWRPKQIQSLLLRYIREYVTCENCRSPQTVLEKDSNTRLFFLTCSICGANRSVNSIRTGFHAQMKHERRQAKKALTK